jgi:hypothetical protein
MMYGAVLIVCSVVAPAGALLWNTLSGVNTATRSSKAVSPQTQEPSSTSPADNAVTPSTGVMPPSNTRVPPAIAAGAGRAGAVRTSSGNTPRSAQEARERAAILGLYHTWKTCWTTGDIETIMALYAAEIRFRDAGYQLYNRDRLRGWFDQLWQNTRYEVRDITTPTLSIEGDRAILLVGQSYRPGRRLRFTNRYIWKKQPIQQTEGTEPNTGEPNTGKPSPQWLIVEEAYLNFQGSSDLHDQIY